MLGLELLFICVKNKFKTKRVNCEPAKGCNEHTVSALIIIRPVIKAFPVIASLSVVDVAPMLYMKLAHVRL